MTQAADAPPTPDPVRDLMRVMTVAFQLALKAFRSESEQALIFGMLNDTVGLIRYERAALWSTQGMRPRLLGVSGQVRVDGRTELAEAWQTLVAGLPEQGKPLLLDRQALGLEEAPWRIVTDGARQVAWVPLRAEGEPLGGLWLERPTETPWSSQELGLLQMLAEAYGAAWHRHRPRRLSRLMARLRRRWALLALPALAAAVYLGFFVPLHLKVVAPCEVVARDPYLVTAPLDGVIERVTVQPGQLVRPGTLLFRFDGRVARQELEVARHQVEVVGSQLERATVLALEGKKTENELKILTNRLKLERNRLQLAQYTVSRLEVRARVGGVVQLSDPDAWRGKPVQVGERVLVLVDPERTQLRIWIPEDDKVPGLSENVLHAFLNVSPERSRTARLTFLANQATVSPLGLPSYMAEARWQHASQPPALGLKGTAILYGRRASLAYWLMRKPWTGLRSRLGR